MAINICLNGRQSRIQFVSIRSRKVQFPLARIIAIVTSGIKDVRSKVARSESVRRERNDLIRSKKDPEAIYKLMHRSYFIDASIVLPDYLGRRVTDDELNVYENFSVTS